MKNLKKILLMFLVILIAFAGGSCVLAYFHIIDIPIISELAVRIGTGKETLTYDNGDYVYRPDEKQLSFDENAAVIFYNNLLTVYTFEDLSAEEAEELADSVDGKVAGELSGSMNVLQIRIEEASLEEIQEKATQLMEQETVLYAGYSYPIQIAENEGDSNPWNSDENSPESDRGNKEKPAGTDWWAEAIGAYTAWEYDDLSQPVKVGILDNGFDEKHPDLKGKITWLPGYEAHSKDDHGTHVAGIIAANNNTIGIRGIADKAELICSDWEPPRGVDYLSSGEYIAITKQMIDSGAKAINNSWGSIFYSKEGYTQILYDESDALKYLLDYYVVHSTGSYDSYAKYIEAQAKRTGMDCILMIMELLLNNQEEFIIIQSAGNGYEDNHQAIDAEYNGHYCAVDEELYNLLSGQTREKLSNLGVSYEKIEKRIMIVGAAENTKDAQGNYLMTSFSNYGENVEICAPGKNVYSTLTLEDDKQKKGAVALNNGRIYGNSDGTSMAAPMVTASAAYLWSLQPEWSAEKIHDTLLESAKASAVGVGVGSNFSYPMLNIGEAVKSVLKDIIHVSHVEAIHSYEDGEYGIFSGISESGESVWRYETKHYEPTELEQISGIGINEGKYYINESGTIIAIELQTGEIQWSNDEFGGTGSYVFDDIGNMYACGFYGPDLFIIDKDGKTINRYESLNSDYMWPHKIWYDAGYIFITYEGDYTLIYNIADGTISSPNTEINDTENKAYAIVEAYWLSLGNTVPENVEYEGTTEYGYCFWGYNVVDAHANTHFRIAVDISTGRLFDYTKNSYIN